MPVLQSIINGASLSSRGAARALQWIKLRVLRHKFLSAIAAVVLLAVGWYAYGAATNTSGETRYVLGTVGRGTLVSSVSASGQVAAGQTLDLVPKASGEIVYVGVTPGEHVDAGTLVAEIDPTDADKQVRDARANLQSAQLSLAKLTEPASTLTLAQAEDALAAVDGSSRTDIVNAYLDLPDIMSGLDDIVTRIGSNQFASWNIGTTGGDDAREQALADYDAADAAYKKAFADYQSTQLAAADDAAIQSELKETEQASELVAAAVKSSSAYLQWYEAMLKTQDQTPPGSADTDLSTLSTYAGKLTTHLGALSGDQSSYQEKKLSLQQVQTGPDTLDVQSSELAVTKARNALSDAQATLANYYVRAPFAGVIGDVAVSKYDQAGSGAVATLITDKQIADLSLNEVDAAKISVGDKATLTFDAVPDLTLTGTIAEIDPVGAVSQGVVSYDVKIAFDAQDSRIKTGMTVNADIQTDVAQNAVYVPSGTVKTSGGQSYVLAFTPPIASSTAAAAGAQGVLSAEAPQMIPVTTGVSDDTDIEITSGLAEGEQIVVRTTSGTTAATAASATRQTGAARGGGFGGGGGAVRF